MYKTNNGTIFEIIYTQQKIYAQFPLNSLKTESGIYKVISKLQPNIKIYMFIHGVSAHLVMTQGFAGQSLKTVALYCWKIN